MRKRVLLVDDHPDISEMVSMMLEETYDVTVARNGEEALLLVGKSEFDAILLDLRMPVLDGEGFLKKSRASGVASPVIVISATRELADKARALGAAGFLIKPFNFDALETMLRSILAPVN